MNEKIIQIVILDVKFPVESDSALGKIIGVEKKGLV